MAGRTMPAKPRGRAHCGRKEPGLCWSHRFWRPVTFEARGVALLGRRPRAAPHFDSIFAAVELLPFRARSGPFRGRWVALRRAPTTSRGTRRRCPSRPRGDRARRVDGGARRELRADRPGIGQLAAEPNRQRCQFARARVLATLAVPRTVVPTTRRSRSRRRSQGDGRDPARRGLTGPGRRMPPRRRLACSSARSELHVSGWPPLAPTAAPRASPCATQAAVLRVSAGRATVVRPTRPRSTLRATAKRSEGPSARSQPPAPGERRPRPPSTAGRSAPPTPRTHAVTCALWTSSAPGRSTIVSIRPPRTKRTRSSPRASENWRV
jgi:hypothetical protein